MAAFPRSEFVALLRAEWKTILRIALGITVLVTLWSFIMPQTYTSSCTILPPKKEEGGSGLMDILSGGAAPEMFDIGSTFGFGGRPSDLFVRLLTSRTVSDSLILQHHLARFFEIDEDRPWRLAAEPLKEATMIDAAKDGSVTVSVRLSTGIFASAKDVDSVKNLAALLANEYIRLLDVVNREKLVSRARATRLYIADQLVETKRDLDSAYVRLVAFQEGNKTVMVDKQLEALVTAAGTLKMKVAEAAAELRIAQRDLRPGSRALLELQANLDAVQEQYAQLQGSPGANADLLVPFMKLPQAAASLAKLVRAVKIQEEINAYLNKQYYKERIQEARDVPTVQVLDAAIPAYQRTSPRRLQWAVVSALLGLIAGMGFVVLRASLRRRVTGTPT